MLVCTCTAALNLQVVSNILSFTPVHWQIATDPDVYFYQAIDVDRDLEDEVLNYNVPTTKPSTSHERRTASTRRWSAPKAAAVCHTRLTTARKRWASLNSVHWKCFVTDRRAASTRTPARCCCRVWIRTYPTTSASTTPVNQVLTWLHVTITHAAFCIHQYNDRFPVVLWLCKSNEGSSRAWKRLHVHVHALQWPILVWCDRAHPQWLIT